MIRKVSYFLPLFVLLNLISTGYLYAFKKTTFFNQRWLKAVVSIEKNSAKNKTRPIGTGFLINSENHHLLLVSAKHVVVDSSGKIKNGLSYRVNIRGDKNIIVNDQELVKLGGGSWFLSETADLAIRFMYRPKGSDLLSIPQKMFLKNENIQPGTPALILGFPMGLRSKKYTTPIVRKAIVSLKEPDFFVIDGFAFPGNSGGPVVYMPAHQRKGIPLSNYIGKQMLLGVVSSYIPYKDTAISRQTKRPRITFEENSGLTIVVPAEELLNLVNRNDVKEFDKKLNN